jgi:hypothetical protein
MAGNASGERVFVSAALGVGALAVLEVALVFAGALPPVLSYSPVGVLFSLARLLLIAWAGYSAAGPGWGKAAWRGALLGAEYSALLCFAALAGKALSLNPVLGVGVPDSVSLALLLAAIVAANSLLGALVATVARACARALKA